MITIPRQLRNKEFRFIKILSRDKKPIERNWQESNNYTFDSAELINWLNNNNNYGIICGKGNLAVIDCDEQEIADLVEKFLPDTFAVKTGSGGKHYYFIVYDWNKTTILTGITKDDTGKIIEEKHCGEIRSTNSQIVAPNSIHPNGNAYQIIYNNEIAHVHKDTLDILFRQYLEKNKQIETTKKDYTKYKMIDINKIIKLDGFDQHGNEYQGSHPVHGSTTKLNFSVNVDKCIWHCFRHNTGGGIVTLIAMLNGIIRCADCRDGCVTRVIFADVVKIAKEKYGIIIDEELK